ncbi:MAG: ABC transporter ATP-binding protein [Nitrosomonadales bacterium]|nr:ABC transporter ATP-binding protein [Nitrosomonadales bacterium]
MSSPAPDATTLIARNLTRHYGQYPVVQDVSLTLKRGEVLGLLGHNGAGKSTTLQMLSGILTPDSGEIEICGLDLLRAPMQAKRRLGFLPEVPPLYRELSVDAYLTFAAKLRRVSPDTLPDALADAKYRCGLNEMGPKLIATLSKGYQQRVGIAQAIIHQPDIIILDEPTVGLDPAQLRDIRALIRELGDTHSVILSTHLLTEVETLCDRVEIMRDGKLIYSDTRAHMAEYGDTASLEEAFMQITETEEEPAP